MSNTVIQIKRSSTTATPGNLEAGELAYSGNSEVLFIGSVNGTNTANVIAIAGIRNPGVLTANQALVANSSSWINTVQTSKLIVGNTSETVNITSIAVTSNSTALGTPSNTELATTYAIKKFVDDKTASISGAVSDTQVVFSNSGVFTGSNAFTFNDDTLTVSVSNTLIIGTNVNLTNNSISVGNSSVNTSITSSSISTTGTVTVSDTTESSNTTSGAVTIAGGLGVAKKINAKEIAVGNTSVYATINSTALGIENVYATGTVNASTLSVGGWVVGNNSGIFTSGVVNADIIQVGTFFKANTTTVTVANTLTVSGLANLASANVVGNLNVAGVLRAGNTTITGDLNVTGTVTTVDTVNLVVEDSLIRLARNQANTGVFTDAVDIGLYGVFGNTSATFYSGFARESGTENWILFANTVNAPDNDGVEIGLGSLGTLYGYLNSSGLTTNSSSVNITANSSVSVSITANTLNLATVLSVNSGGTGVSSLTNNAILIGNTAGPVTQLASSTEGHVLQITSGVPAFGMLDGGTF